MHQTPYPINRENCNILHKQPKHHNLHCLHILHNRKEIHALFPANIHEVERMKAEKFFQVSTLSMLRNVGIVCNKDSLDSPEGAQGSDLLSRLSIEMNRPSKPLL